MTTPQINSISVNYAGMQDAEDNIWTAYTRLQAEHDDLFRFLQNLRGDWHGQAGQTWDGVQNQWNGSFTWILEQLRTLHLTLVNSHHNYHTTDNGLARNWSGLG